MKTTLTRATITLLAIVGALILVVGNGLGNRQVRLAAQSPSENWSVSAIPYVGPGYKSRPVVVTSVMSDTSKGYKVTDVALKNISSKPAAAVRLSWNIYSDKANSILLRGQTTLITWSEELPENARRQIKHDILSFAHAAKQLANEGGLDGHYRIEVGVSEILFADGSIWTVDGNQTDEAAFIKTSLSKRFVPLKVTPLSPQQFCPNQACTFAPGPPAGFTCTSTVGVICTNCGLRCCNTVCGEPACDCGPDT